MRKVSRLVWRLGREEGGGDTHVASITSVAEHTLVEIITHERGGKDPRDECLSKSMTNIDSTL